MSDSSDVLMSLKVLSGPDLGLQRTFENTTITIGRGSTNSFALSDGFVSNFHGEIRQLPNNDIVYVDLQSRHGSLVNVDNVSYHLHNKEDQTQIRITNATEIQLGCTLMRLELRQANPLPIPAAPDASLSESSSFKLAKSVRETLITATHQAVPALTEQLAHSDKRLAEIFGLAGRLNGLTQLDEILELIIETVFEAFPPANFFALTMLQPDQEIEDARPLITRRRLSRESLMNLALGDEASEEDEPIISKSILRRVVDSQESVLFVKDSLGTEISQSIIDAKITACLCAPLVGQKSLLGIIEIDTRGQGSLFSKKDLDLFNIVASLAAFALERARLSENIVEMFESFVYASVNAIEARDPTTAGHSERVALYTLELATVVNDIDTGSSKDIFFDEEQMTELRYASLLHDFGKIAVREDVLQKARRLSDVHLELIHQRFQTIKALAYREHVEAPLMESVKSGQKADLDYIEQAQLRHQQFGDALDEAFGWLEKTVASKGWLSPEEMERVRQIGARTYRDAHGHTHPFLTPYEIENLTIQKGTLNEDEWENMRSHAKRSEDYLERIPWSPELKNVPCIAGAHHEKLDGSGYPQGLGAQDIVPQVRMLTISDIFDALTASDRPYRKAASVERACSILQDEARTNKLDAEFVQIFEKLVIPRILKHIPSLRQTQP